MTIRAATPYLILKGKAAQAIAFYERALGAKVQERKAFGEVMQSCPAAQKDLVMHAELRFGNTVLMLSDGPGPGDRVTGDIAIALQFDDANQAHQVFAELATGGQVREPLFEAPWGGLFGDLNDQFGVNWMFSTTPSA